MARRYNGFDFSVRQQVADEAARLIMDQGIKDYRLAKSKAAERLGVEDRGALPSNAEIEAQLNERLRVFNAAEHSSRVERFRRLALETMALFDRFSPRAAGAVVSGALSETAALELHLFADAAEEVALALEERKIPYDQGARKFRIQGRTAREFPAFHFVADDVPVDLVTFPIDGVRQAPICPVNRRPMKRLSYEKLKALVKRQPISDP